MVLQQLQEERNVKEKVLAGHHVELVWARGQLDGVLLINQDLVQELIKREQIIEQLKPLLPADVVAFLERQQRWVDGCLGFSGSRSEQCVGGTSTKGTGLEQVAVAEAVALRCSEDPALLDKLTPVAVARGSSRSASRGETPEMVGAESQSRSNSSTSAYSRSSAYSSDSEWQEPSSAFGHLLQSTELLQSSLTDTGLQSLQRQQLEQQLLSTSLKLSRRQQRLGRQPWHSKSPVKRSKLQQQGAAGTGTSWGRGLFSSSMPELSSMSMEKLGEYKVGVQGVPAPEKSAGCVDGVSYELGLEGEPRQPSPIGAAAGEQGCSWAVGPSEFPPAPKMVTAAVDGGAGDGPVSSSRSSSSSASAMETLHDILHQLQNMTVEDVKDSSSLMAASAQLAESCMQQQPPQQQQQQQLSEGPQQSGIDSGLRAQDVGSEQQAGGAGLRVGRGVMAASELQVASARKLAAAQGSLAMMRVLENIVGELQDLGARKEQEGKHKGCRKGTRHQHSRNVLGQIGESTSNQPVGTEALLQAGGDMQPSVAAAASAPAAGNGPLEHGGSFGNSSIPGGPGTPPGCIARSLIGCFNEADAASGALQILPSTTAAAAASPFAAAAGMEKVVGTTSSSSSGSLGGGPLEQLMQQQQVELDGIRQLVAGVRDAAAPDEIVEQLHGELQDLRAENFGLLQQLSQLVFVQQQLREELQHVHDQLRLQQAVQGLRNEIEEGKRQREQQHLAQEVGGWDPLLGLGGVEVSDRTLDVWEEEYTRKLVVGSSMDGSRSVGCGESNEATAREVKLICQVLGVGEEGRVSVCIVALGHQGQEWDEMEEGLRTGECLGSAACQQQQAQPDQPSQRGILDEIEEGGAMKQQQSSMTQGLEHLLSLQPLYHEVGEQGMDQRQQQHPADEGGCDTAGSLDEPLSMEEGREGSREWQQFQLELAARQQQLEQLQAQLYEQLEEKQQQQAQLQVRLQQEQQQLEHYSQAQQQLKADLAAAQMELQEEQLALQEVVARYQQLRQEKEGLLQQCQQLEGEKGIAEEQSSSYRQQIESMQEEHGKQLAQLQQEVASRDDALEQQLAALQEQHDRQLEEQLERQAAEVNEVQDRLTKAEMKVGELQVQLEVSLLIYNQAGLTVHN